MNLHKLVLRTRIAEAELALCRIAHHIDCPGMGGTRRNYGEPKTCFRGDGNQGPCMRIAQWKRIELLKKRLRDAQ